MSLPAYKYASLQNDFILFDLTKFKHVALNQLLTPSYWQPKVMALTDRKNGIGADGVLTLSRHVSVNYPIANVFNPDGLNGDFSVNGIRCVADYLINQGPTQTSTDIMMGQHLIHCQKQLNGDILANIKHASYLDNFNINYGSQNHTAHRIDVGNPHLIIFGPMTIDELKKIGQTWSYYQGKPYNLSFAWPDVQKKNSYHLLTYERGLGFSNACGSAVIATFKALQTLSDSNQHSISFIMPGGVATCHVKKDHGIEFSAPVGGEKLPNSQNTLKIFL